MTPENFCYWLRGRTEDRDVEPPTEAEWQTILKHLDLVFNDPPVDRGPEPPASCDHEWQPDFTTFAPNAFLCIECGAKKREKSEPSFAPEECNHFWRYDQSRVYGGEVAGVRCERCESVHAVPRTLAQDMVMGSTGLVC